MKDFVFYWPDGCWCRQAEFSEMTHRGDDFGILEVDLALDDDHVDRLVDELVSWPA